MCTHLERLTSELEAAAHPALDALTNKVKAGHMLCNLPESNKSYRCLFLVDCCGYVSHIACLCHIHCVAITHVLLAAKLWCEHNRAFD